MTVKCDYCEMNVKCDICDQHEPILGAKDDWRTRDHYHTCGDIDCAEGLDEIAELEDSYGDNQ